MSLHSMKSRYPLADYECHIVRETPELGWDAATWAEAQDRDRLPIDLPAIEDDGPVPAYWICLFDIELAIAAVTVVGLALWVLL